MMIVIVKATNSVDRVSLTKAQATSKYDKEGLVFLTIINVTSMKFIPAVVKSEWDKKTF